MLDEYCGMVMTFDALSKELYSLRQASGENVAEFGVHLSQEVQILATSYSDLLLAAWKLERQNEARDPLLPKTTTTGRSNITHSQTPANVFPSQKLKGNQTFTACLASLEGNKVEEDLYAMPE